jgi:hypothetical protein
MWHGDQYGPDQDLVNSLSADNADLHNFIGELTGLLADAGYRLNEYRKICGCLSMKGICPRCTKTLAIENRISAAHERATTPGSESGGA